jgi:hypothetical protein
MMTMCLIFIPGDAVLALVFVYVGVSPAIFDVVPAAEHAASAALAMSVYAVRLRNMPSG